jgi:hypothetical protein
MLNRDVCAWLTNFFLDSEKHPLYLNNIPKYEKESTTSIVSCCSLNYKNIRNQNIPIDLHLKIADAIVEPILLYGSEIESTTSIVSCCSLNSKFERDFLLEILLLFYSHSLLISTVYNIINTRKVFSGFEHTFQNICYFICERHRCFSGIWRENAERVRYFSIIL